MGEQCGVSCGEVEQGAVVGVKRVVCMRRGDLAGSFHLISLRTL